MLTFTLPLERYGQATASGHLLKLCLEALSPAVLWLLFPYIPSSKLKASL
jgi:hypothetical protein